MAGSGLLQHTGGMTEHDFDAIYAAMAEGEAPPWEIATVQPGILQVLAGLELGRRVLDLGCGTGDLCLHLAGLGHEVAGIDISGIAINLAKAKAADRGLAATFRVGDARHPSDVAGPIRDGYDAVFDSGLMHGLDAAERATYASELPQVVAPGGVVVVLARAPGELGFGVPTEELTASFDSDAWIAVDVHEAEVVAGPDQALHMPGHVVVARKG